MAVREPDLRPFRADLLIVDVPLVVGLEAVGLRATVMAQLGERARTGPRAGGELLDWRAAGTTGADLNPTALPRPVGLERERSDTELREIAETTAALGRAWVGPHASEIRGRSLATAYAVAARGGIPIATNAIEVWRISRAWVGPGGTSALVAGSTELMLYAVSSGVIEPSDAWDAYRSLVDTIAGLTPGWPVGPNPQGDRTRETFLGWAREAVAGRL